MDEQPQVKVRCKQPGSHPEVGTWREGEVRWMPLHIARALIDAKPKAAEAVDESIPLTFPVPGKKAAQRRATAPEAEKAVLGDGPAAGRRGRRGKAEEQETVAKPVPPPAPGTRR